MAIQQIVPSAVAKAGSRFSGTYDVTEHHGGQEAVRLGGVTRAGQKLLDLA
jgi:hypothetical protein